MSWENRLSAKPASIDGLAFDVISTDDNLSYALATHSYPYRNGANLDGMGREARRIRMTAVFWQDDYEDALEALLAVLDKSGTKELVHPIFGSLKVQVQSVGAPFTADQPNYCELPIELLEDGLDTPLFGEASVTTRTDGVCLAADAASLASESAFASYLAAAKDGLQAMNGAMAAMKREAYALAAPVFQTLDLVTDAVDYMAAPVMFVQDLRAGFDARIGALAGRVALVEALPGALAKALTFGQGKAPATTPNPASWDEVRNNLRITLLPAQYVDVDNVVRSQPAVVMTQIALTQSLALAVAATDFLQNEFSSPVNGSRAALMSPDAVAMLVADARTDIQAAIDAWRSTYPNLEQQRPVTEKLKAVAVGLEALGEAVINQRPPLITRVVPRNCNLRLLAHWWYADAERSLELLRLNPSIRQPNFIHAGRALLAYAK